MSWLNAVAFENMSPVYVTFPIFHADMSWLKAIALVNILSMYVTLPISHPEMSSLNVFLSIKTNCIFVMRDVHQVPIGQPHLLLKTVHAVNEGFRVQDEVI